MSLGTWIDERSLGSDKRLQTVSRLTDCLAILYVTSLFALSVQGIWMISAGRTSFWITSVLDSLLNKALILLG